MAQNLTFTLRCTLNFQEVRALESIFMSYPPAERLFVGQREGMLAELLLDCRADEPLRVQNQRHFCLLMDCLVARGRIRSTWQRTLAQAGVLEDRFGRHRLTENNLSVALSQARCGASVFRLHLEGMVRKCLGL